MGYEYQITCPSAAVTKFDEFLCRQTFFESFDEQFQLYNLTHPDFPKPGGRPHVYVSLNADGVTICDNLSSNEAASLIIRCLLDHALSYSDKITIHEP